MEIIFHNSCLKSTEKRTLCKCKYVSDLWIASQLRNLYLCNTAAVIWKGILIFGMHIITPSEDKEDLDLGYYILSRLPVCLCESGAFRVVSLPTHIPNMHYI